MPKMEVRSLQIGSALIDDISISYKNSFVNIYGPGGTRRLSKAIY